VLAALIISLTTHAAPPASIDPATLRALTEVVGARVEAHAGRPFDHLPELVLIRTDALAAARVEALRDTWEGHADAPALAAAMSARANAALARHVGLYVHAEDRVYLFEDNIQAYVADALGPAGLLEPYVVCTLAHELTHALQFQIAGEPRPRNPRDSIVIRTLREGHANLVGEAVCRELDQPAVIGFDRGMQGIDALASRPRTLPEIGRRDDGVLLLHYGYGQRYVARVVDRGGTAAAWEALATPGLGMQRLLEVALENLPPDTETPEASARVASLLVPEAEQRSSGDLDTVDPLGPLGPEGLAHIPEATGAWTRERWSADGKRATVWIVRFSAAEAPAALVRARLRLPSLLPWTPDARLARRAGVSTVARQERSGTRGPIHSIWAASGDQLVVVELAGGPVRARRLVAALRAAADGSVARAAP
jgi:hypothetical protein